MLADSCQIGDLRSATLIPYAMLTVKVPESVGVSNALEDKHRDIGSGSNLLILSAASCQTDGVNVTIDVTTRSVPLRYYHCSLFHLTSFNDKVKPFASLRQVCAQVGIIMRTKPASVLFPHFKLTPPQVDATLDIND